MLTGPFTILPLAERPAVWHSLLMQKRSPRAGGFLLILCIFLGVVIGAMRGEPSLGFLIGAGLGVMAAIATWLIDRRRTG